MVTQEFLSDLWSVNGLPFKNIDIRKSFPAEAIPRASVSCGTRPRSNPDKSINGSRADGYRAPNWIYIAQPPALPPSYQERNSMEPLQQKEQNLMMERIAVPDPRMNITGNNVPTTQRLENMDIQTAPFNYSAIIGVVGILLGVVAIVWLARRK